MTGVVSRWNRPVVSHNQHISDSVCQYNILYYIILYILYTIYIIYYIYYILYILYTILYYYIIVNL